MNLIVLDTYVDRQLFIVAELDLISHPLTLRIYYINKVDRARGYAFLLGIYIFIFPAGYLHAREPRFTQQPRPRAICPRLYIYLLVIRVLCAWRLIRSALFKI